MSKPEGESDDWALFVKQMSSGSLSPSPVAQQDHPSASHSGDLLSASDLVAGEDSAAGTEAGGSEGEPAARKKREKSKSKKSSKKLNINGKRSVKEE